MSGSAPDGEHLVEAMPQAVHQHVSVGHGTGVDVDAHAASPAVGHQERSIRVAGTAPGR